ncbi:MAG TPA: methionine adenosyltransferase [Candidatus Colwellbacteria bacterium]|nr:methionine adenosyltransferase [Candidatus Colwellbacteria bacterium]
MPKEFSVYSVESVTSGHPDKICDQISDAILDECLREDPESRVAVESFGGHGLIVVGGEVTSKAKVDYKKIALEVYRGIGYEDDPEVIVNIVTQSSDIALGVDTGGAGDQGIMYGYATDETPEFLPKGVVLAHKLTFGLERMRKSAEVGWLLPDGKAQVTISSGETTAVLVSASHQESVSHEEIRQTLKNKLIIPIVGDIPDERILVNPTGKFVKAGFEADTGLTGRKIMVDTYGGVMPHGGGCFSGKDATKVDRSAAYMCRFAAKNIVAAGLSRNCVVSVAYAIGRAEPLMLEATGDDDKDLTEVLKRHFDFRPRAIIERLGLKKPIYRETSVYGHFGKENLPWERIIDLDRL